MSEAKDPAIKLFGRRIPLQEIAAGSGNDSSGAPSSACGVEENCTDQDPPCTANSSADNRDGEEREVDKDTLEAKPSETTQKEGARPLTLEDCAGQDATAGINENPKTPSIDNETATLKSSKSEDEQSDTGVSEEKTLKKPDKIIPCPRCNSMDTKFCYYNNYNVNQPRHFCKNCQRYWTAGGTMRNVPVGAGRRKNKSAASHYRHITVSEALQTARSDVPNGIHHPTLQPNGTVLTFGSDSPLCDSMASVLSLAEKTMRNCSRNGFNKPEELIIPVSYGGSENGDDKLSGSSVTASNSKDEVGQTGMQEPPVMRNCQGFPPQQIPCFPGAPWPYPWNSAQWNPSVPPPAFCPSGYPMPFFPAAAYWGCAVPGAWTVPWIPQPSSPKHQFSSSGPTSPLGKHARDEDQVKPSNSGEETSKESTSERCLWIPKTLRIDDPGEAAKSSIWATLGIKNEMGDSIGGRGLFKAFQSKGHEKNHVAKTSPVLQANPAALCRSLNFHESS